MLSGFYTWCQRFYGIKATRIMLRRTFPYSKALHTMLPHLAAIAELPQVTEANIYHLRMYFCSHHAPIQSSSLPKEHRLESYVDAPQRYGAEDITPCKTLPFIRTIQTAAILFAYGLEHSYVILSFELNSAYFFDTGMHQSEPRLKIAPSLKKCHPVIEAEKERMTADPEAFESQYVHSVYETTASHFSHTRTTVWPAVQRFLDSLGSGAIVLDCGCGNGKNLGCAYRFNACGLDYSPSLLAIAAERMQMFAFVQGNALTLPFRTSFFDATMAIAVLHHFSTEERRRMCLQELARVTAPDGDIFITAWAVQQFFDKDTLVVDSQDSFVPWSMQLKNPAYSAADKDLQMMAPPHSNPQTNPTVCLDRFYHLFRPEELSQLCTAVGLTVRFEVYDAGNYIVRCVKESKQ